MTELLTFDLDDTLWDAGPVLARAEALLYAWLAAEAPQLTARYSMEDLVNYRRQFAKNRPELRHDFTLLRIHALAELLPQAGHSAELAEPAVAAFLAARSEVEMYEDAVHALGSLRPDFRLVAITNGNTDLDRAGLAHYFEFCVSPALAKTAKPDPRMFEIVAERTGVAPGATIHIGDEPYYDVEAAHRANVSAIWVNRAGREWPQDLRPAEAEIASFTELRAAIATIENLKRSQQP